MHVLHFHVCGSLQTTNTFCHRPVFCLGFVLINQRGVFLGQLLVCWCSSYHILQSCVIRCPQNPCTLGLALHFNSIKQIITSKAYQDILIIFCLPASFFSQLAKSVLSLWKLFLQYSHVNVPLVNDTFPTAVTNCSAVVIWTALWFAFYPCPILQQGLQNLACHLYLPTILIHRHYI